MAYHYITIEINVTKGMNVAYRRRMAAGVSSRRASNGIHQFHMGNSANVITRCILKSRFKHGSTL
jgi:hypothetical protein